MTRSMAIEYQYQLDVIESILESSVLTEHYSEMSTEAHHDYDPDIDMFLELQKLGGLVTYTVRHYGDVVGYCVAHVSHSLHNKSKIRAAIDNIYVSKDHRGRCGAKLIAFVSEQLLSYGVTDVYHMIPVKRDWSAVLRRQGYSHVESVYHKGL